MYCDVKCSRCGKQYGWSGKAQDFPPCPLCGYRPDSDAIQRDAEIIQEFQDYLRGRHTRSHIKITHELG